MVHFDKTGNVFLNDGADFELREVRNLEADNVDTGRAWFRSFRWPNELFGRENLSVPNKRLSFLFRSIPNGQSGSTGEVGVDKKMQTAEYFVITMPWAGKVRSAAVICVEWIQSVGLGEREPYCEMMLSQQ